MAGPALDRVLQRLHGVKPIGHGWVAKCPVHDDVIPSLQVSERTDLSVGLHCHAGCTTKHIVEALGLTWADLFSGTEADGKQIVKEYDYRDSDGVLLYQTVRYWPKEFSQRRPDPAQPGKWIHNLLPFKGKHVPYRLPDLKGHNDVCIVEGEKDADRLWSLGIAATTNIGGAKNWSSSDTKYLKAAGCTRAFIIPDNDEAGHARVGLIAQSLKTHTQIAVVPLELPDVGPHEDVSDWLSNGGSKEALQSLMAGTLYVVPPGHVPEPGTPVHALPDALPDPLAYKIGPTVGAGAAEAFRDRYKDKLRFDHTREWWYVWDQHRWRQDTDEEVMRLALTHSRRWGQEVVGAAPDFTERKRWQDYTLKLERRPDRATMLLDARALEPFAGTPKWDADPWLLGVPNGVIDLRTSKLRDGTPGDWISQQVGTAYDAAAVCPRWLQFLDEVFDGDASLIEYIHKAVGYSLTADMREQCFFMASGTGSNGKSIFLNTMEALFGSYGVRASMQLFIGEASKFDVAELRGARMVFAAESKKDTRLNCHTIKSLTGGETQQAERKHEHPFVFRPVGKIWLAVNHVPKVDDDSFAFWRRVKPVLFQQTFTGASEDQQLRDKLLAELPGILAWAVQGTAAWLQHGIIPPPKVKAWAAEYQTAEDPLEEFITDRCKLDPDGVTTFAALQAAYNRWADIQKIARYDRLTRRSIGIHLKRRFTMVEGGGTRRYRGVSIPTESQEPDLLNQPEPPDQEDQGDPDAF